MRTTPGNGSAPVSFPGIDLDLLGVWAMHGRGSEDRPKRGRMHAAIEHYAGFLRRGRAIVIGDLNDNVRWDTPRYPSFARLTNQLAQLGLVNLYYALTGEEPGQESQGSFFWYRHRDKPYLIDHAYLPKDWVSSVTGFGIGSWNEWHDASDHTPLTLELGVRSPDPKGGRADPVADGSRPGKGSDTAMRGWRERT